VAVERAAPCVARFPFRAWPKLVANSEPDINRRFIGSPLIAGLSISPGFSLPACHVGHLEKTPVGPATAPRDIVCTRHEKRRARRAAGAARGCAQARAFQRFTSCFG
jgi:hypothetical protein